MNAGPVSTRCLALPLRIGANGQFERADQVRSLMALIAAMAVTAPGAWPHAPWFALLPVFSRTNPALDEHPAVAEALNVALGRLGVSAARVGAVRTSPREESAGVRAFEVTLVLEGGHIAHEHLQV